MAQPQQSTLDGPVPVPDIFVNRDQYNVDQSIYPDDLMGPESPYGNNMVVFYISVQSDSKLITDGSAVLARGPELERLTSTIEQNGLSENEATAIITAETAAAGAAGGQVLFNKWSVGGWLGGAFGYGAAKASGKAKRETKTIQQAIGLYMPNNLSTNYSMGWDTSDTALGSTGIEALKALEKSWMGPFSTIGSSIAGEVLRNSPTASRLTATTGNPKKEQIFQGVDFRNFSFDYKFWPRNAGETQKVQNIIKLFKLHMHPEFSPTEGNFLYLYPSEFDIRYYHRTGPDGQWVENLNIHRHTSCVLSNMAVNYGENGVYSSFKDGHPTQISMTLQFKELALLTKENIQNGY